MAGFKLRMSPSKIVFEAASVLNRLGIRPCFSLQLKFLQLSLGYVFSTPPCREREPNILSSLLNIYLLLKEKNPF